jgi:hypothetical protein
MVLMNSPAASWTTLILSCIDPEVSSSRAMLIGRVSL